MSTATTTTSTAADYAPLPRATAMHTTDVYARLDTPLRHEIARVIEHGWQPTDAHRTPRDLATAIAYGATLIGASGVSAMAAAHIACPQLDVRTLVDAVNLGVSRAQQYAEDAIEVEIKNAAIKRSLHASASWTARIYMRPITPTTTTPKQTSYACAILDADGQPTAELRALVDALGDPVVLDLDRELDRVFVLRDRVVGRRARAITADDQSRTKHLLRLDGY